MFKIKFHLIKHHSHNHHRKHHAHRQIRVGKNWFFLHSVPNPNHPEYEEQKAMCIEVVNDLVKYGLLDTKYHSRVWKISKDVHIPSLRYWMCCMYPQFKFRLKSKHRWFSKTRDVRIYLEHGAFFTYQPCVYALDDSDASYRP